MVKYSKKHKEAGDDFSMEEKIEEKIEEKEEERLFNKKYIINVIITLLTPCLIFLWNHRAQDIEDIVGRELKVQNGNVMRLIYRTSFSKDGGQLVNSQDINKMDTLIEHMKQYGFKLTSDKNEDVESYTVLISSDEVISADFRISGDILSMVTLGNQYIEIKNKNGSYKTYKIIEGTVDTMYFKELYQSIK